MEGHKRFVRRNEGPGSSLSDNGRVGLAAGWAVLFPDHQVFVDIKVCCVRWCCVEWQRLSKTGAIPKPLNLDKLCAGGRGVRT